MKILIVDDDVVVRESLNVIFSSHASFDVIGLAENGKIAVEIAKQLKPDLILMDISMPEMTGIEATHTIKNSSPEIKIVMLTTFMDYKNILQSLKAGADGYLLKSDPYEKQVETIKMVSEGHAVISQKALQQFSEKKSLHLLTARENDVLELVANGLTNKEIANTLFMSEGTIRNIISIILEKLMLRDRTQLAIYYWQKHS